MCDTDVGVRAKLFFNVSAEKAGKSVDQLAIDILEKKINAYERFNAQYPGYGGTVPITALPPSPALTALRRLPALVRDHGLEPLPRPARLGRAILPPSLCCIPRAFH